MLCRPAIRASLLCVGANRLMRRPSAVKSIGNLVSSFDHSRLLVALEPHHFIEQPLALAGTFSTGGSVRGAPPRSRLRVVRLKRSQPALYRLQCTNQMLLRSQQLQQTGRVRLVNERLLPQANLAQLRQDLVLLANQFSQVVGGQGVHNGLFAVCDQKSHLPFTHFGQHQFPLTPSEVGGSQKIGVLR